MPETFTWVPAYPASSTMDAAVTWSSSPAGAAAARAACQVGSGVPLGSSVQHSADCCVPAGSVSSVPNR